MLLLAHPSLPVKNVRDLIALAKARPDQLAYASSGSGNSDHLAAELFKSMAKLQMVHVPYKGSGPSSIALISGEVSLGFSSIPPVLAHVRGNRLRALGVGSTQRVPSQSDFPTIAESGLPGYEAYSWAGIIGPANMPKEIVQRLSREIVESMKTKEVAERFLASGSVPTPAGAEDFAVHIKAELHKWGEVVRGANIRAN